MTLGADASTRLLSVGRDKSRLGTFDERESPRRVRNDARSLSVSLFLSFSLWNPCSNTVSTNFRVCGRNRVKDRARARCVANENHRSKNRTALLRSRGNLDYQLPTIPRQLLAAAALKFRCDFHHRGSFERVTTNEAP